MRQPHSIDIVPSVLLGRDTGRRSGRWSNVAVIVTADDDRDIREIIAKVLRRDGHTVITVADGAAAVEQARAVRPDLVLLDGQMSPGLSGFDACRQLKGDQELAAIPVIMVTGSMPPEQIRERLPQLHAVVAKPFTRLELKQAVEEALGHTAAR